MLLVLSAVIGLAAADDDSSAVADAMMDPMVLGCLALVVLGLLGYLVSTWFASKPVVPPTATTGRAVAGAGSGSKSPPALVEEDTSLCPLSIYYGSQTGTAEGFAKQISNDSKKHGFRPTVVDLDGFEASWLTDPPKNAAFPRVAIFVTATYGEGEPTDNAVNFVKWLKSEDLDNTTLSGMCFTVFGLGSKQYEHYNATGRFVNKRLTELGATPGYRYGEGDDDGTLEEDFDSWKEELWTGLTRSLGMSAGAGGAARDDAGDSAPPANEWSLVWVGTPADAEATEARVLVEARESLAAHRIEVGLASKPYFSARPIRLTETRELRQAPSRGNSTVHMELDILGSGLSYGTADDLAVLPENDPEIVAALARWLGIEADLDRWFVLEPVDTSLATKPIFPTPCTLRKALTCYCDITGLPNKQFVSYMAHFAGLGEEKRRLLAMTSRAGKEDFHATIVAPQLGIYELFRDFQSVKPPVESLIQLLPRLLVRYYTICSSSEVHRNSIHLAVSVLDTPKPGGAPGRMLGGVCSNYLARATVGHVFRCDVRPSNFKLPADTSVPIIMVGPGTGIAPMRAFLQERHRHHEQTGEVMGPCVLFFGCQRSTTDYIYQDELQAFVANGTLSQLHVAFSREQSHKVYVQHLLKAQGAQVWNWLNALGGYLYVCGSTQMGKDVEAAVLSIATEVGGLSPEAAHKWKDANHHRYIVELW